MQILARIGDVLYWLSWVIAGLFGALAYWLTTLPQYNGDRDFGPVVAIAGCGVVAWVIGRGCKYILRGN